MSSVKRFESTSYLIPSLTKREERKKKKKPLSSLDIPLLAINAHLARSTPIIQPGVGELHVPLRPAAPFHGTVSRRFHFNRNRSLRCAIVMGIDLTKKIAVTKRDK